MVKGNKNYISFWIYIPFALVIGLVLFVPLDLSYNNLYFVTNSFKLSIYYSIFLFISGLGYYICRNYSTNEKLMKVHNLFSMLGSLILILMLIWQVLLKYIVINGDNVEYKNLQYIIPFTLGHLLGGVLIGVGFVSYLMNMIMTCLKRVE